jgi:hypothetical protein
MDRTTAWLSVLRDPLRLRPDLMRPVKALVDRDDAPAIMRLLEEATAEEERKLGDFRREHSELDARVRRLNRGGHDAEASWFEDQVAELQHSVRAWHGYVRRVKVYAGIAHMNDASD